MVFHRNHVTYKQGNSIYLMADVYSTHMENMNNRPSYTLLTYTHSYTVPMFQCYNETRGKDRNQDLH